MGRWKEEQDAGFGLTVMSDLSEGSAEHLQRWPKSE